MHPFEIKASRQSPFTPLSPSLHLGRWVWTLAVRRLTVSSSHYLIVSGLVVQLLEEGPRAVVYPGDGRGRGGKRGKLYLARDLVSHVLYI